MGALRSETAKCQTRSSAWHDLWKPLFSFVVVACFFRGCGVLPDCVGLVQVIGMMVNWRIIFISFDNPLQFTMRKIIPLRRVAFVDENSWICQFEHGISSSDSRLLLALIL